MQRTSKEQIERAARLYKRNVDASAAIGITQHTFGRLCREYGIETPHARMRRQRRQSAKCEKQKTSRKKQPELDRLIETEYTGSYDPRYVRQTRFGRICLNPHAPERNALFDCHCSAGEVEEMLAEAERICAGADLPLDKICGHDRQTYEYLKPVLEERGWEEASQVVMTFENKPRRPNNGEVEIEVIDPENMGTNQSYRTFFADEDMPAWHYRCANEPRLGGEQLVGWLDGKPAGIAGWFAVGGIARFRSVVTQPWARRRGVASALILYVQNHPAVKGQEALVICAREKGYPRRLYERLGFGVRGMMWVFKRPR